MSSSIPELKLNGDAGQRDRTMLANNPPENPPSTPNSKLHVTRVSPDTIRPKVIQAMQLEAVNGAQEHGITDTGEQDHACDYPLWRCSHDTEQQKRMWYHDSLKVGSRKVMDEWGFSSTGVSRAHTPEPPAKEAEAVLRFDDIKREMVVSGDFYKNV